MYLNVDMVVQLDFFFAVVLDWCLKSLTGLFSCLDSLGLRMTGKWTASFMVLLQFQLPFYADKVHRFRLIVCVCSDWTSKVFIIQTLPSLLPIWKTISYTFWYMENRVTIACTMDMCRFNLINIITMNRVTIHLNFCTIARTALRSLCMKRETFDYLN